MEHIIGKSTELRESRHEHWVSMSDLMAGLMMVFLLIAIAYMRFIHVQKQEIEKIAYAYRNTNVAIYNALRTEFTADLERWKAQIDENELSFEFTSDEASFASASVKLRPEFELVIAEFFPAYVRVLGNFKADIQEVRIEGHTSSEWTGSNDPDQSYFLNMALSQGRTREVLQFAYTLEAIAPEREWIKEKFAAVGFSSSHPVLVDGIESREKSRRVRFTVITNAETKIGEILNRSRRDASAR